MDGPARQERGREMIQHCVLSSIEDISVCVPQKSVIFVVAFLFLSL